MRLASNTPAMNGPVVAGRATHFGPAGPQASMGESQRREAEAPAARLINRIRSFDIEPYEHLVSTAWLGAD